MRNPLSNAHIIGAGYDSTEYTLKAHSRGDKAYMMSRSSLKDFAECPSKWLKYGGGDDEGTKSTEWGSLVDCLLLEPDKFDKRYVTKLEQYPVEKDGEIVEFKDWNANSNWCKQWLKDNDRFTPISAGMLKEARNAAAIAEKEFAPFLDASEFQVYIRDFKTTRCADLARWNKEVFSRWYDAQAAMYQDLHEAATGEKIETFQHLLQENEYPYECAEIPLSVEFISLGRKKYVGALKRYCRCLATGYWDTYTDLNTERKRGLNICEPEAWMLEGAPSEDPDWITEKKAA